MTSLREIAEAMNRLHEGSPNTRELAPDYRLVGLEGEDAAAKLLGTSPDFSLRPNGDGGKDMFVVYKGRTYKVDSKASRKHWLDMLVKLPARADIYMYMSYPALKCVGWTWRSIVVQAPVKPGRHDLPSYEVPIEWLRPVEELLAKVGAAP